MAGPGGSVDITGEAELDMVDLSGIGNDILYFDVPLDMLVFGYEKEFAFCFIFLALDRKRSTIF